MINSNKENEINSLYANCQLEKNNITKVLKFILLFLNRDYQKRRL